MTTNHINTMKVRRGLHIRGFTLIEMMVAVTILLMAVVGPLSLIEKSLYRIYYSRDEVLALTLAQEGIEMVRQVRDTNMLSGASWLSGLSDGTYKISVDNFIAGGAVNSFIIPCGGACAPQPVYINASGLYGQATPATRTQFSRIVTISSAGLPSNEVKVTSRVDWQQAGGSTGTVSASEYIFSWAI